MVAKTARRTELGKPPSSTSAQLADPGRKDRDVPATLDSDCSVSIPGCSNPHAMDKHRIRITRTSGMSPWRAGCGENRMSGSEGGPGRPTGGDSGTAPRPDPYTKLPGPLRGVYFDCYVIIDIFSRYVVGWTVEISEDSTIAKALIADAIARHGVGKGQLTLHADRGTSMTSKTVAQLLEDLGVTRTHSRPHVSDDNPYIEAHFKTLKYCPAWPGHFDTVEDARAWCEQFFDYYNHIHRHRALGLHTPASVHYGTATEIRAQRGKTLDAAYAANPSRFAGRPTPPALPTVAWINEPQEALIQNV